MCVMMLPKFCQFLVHINIEMLLQYNAKQGYIHKVLKNRGIFTRTKLSSLTVLDAVDGVGVE